MLSEEIQEIAEENSRAGRPAEAARLYEELRKRNPDDDSFTLALAWAYHDSGQIEQAIACFESLFEKELSRRVFTGFAFDELVRLFKGLGRYDRLLLICEKAAAAQPGDYSLLGDLGDAYMKTGQADRAVEVYRRMIEMEPESSIDYCRLGDALLALNGFVEAEKAYEKAIAIEPDRAAAYYGRLANEFRKAGHFDRAERTIRKGLADDPSEPAAYLLLGDLLILEDRADEGWAAYESAVNLRPASAGSYYFRLGNTLAERSAYEQAAAAFRRAIAVERQNPFYFLNLAAAYASLGREDLALEAIRQAQALN